MELFLPILLFCAGLVLIIKGGDYFVDAAAWFAEVSGIPKVIVGATVVSLATTLPELLVSMMAAFQGKTDMAIGNAVGSVTANCGLILGIALIFAPFAVRRREYLPKAMLMLLAVASLMVFSHTGSLTPAGSAVLIGIMLVFIYENIRSAKKNIQPSVRQKPGRKEVGCNVIKFLAGTAGIVLGADLLVDNGSLLASALGVPESVIGVTIIAVGTSLPEFVTAITSIIKKQGALSAGNIIGANIIDTTLILPLCSIAGGNALPVSAQSVYLDIPACLIISCVSLLPMLVKSKFMRWQGFLMVSLYLIYVAIVVL